jgi:hypothetical protein
MSGTGDFPRDGRDESRTSWCLPVKKGETPTELPALRCPARCAALVLSYFTVTRKGDADSTILARMSLRAEGEAISPLLMLYSTER